LLAGQDFQQLATHRVRQSQKHAIGSRHNPQYTSEISDTVNGGALRRRRQTMQ